MTAAIHEFMTPEQIRCHRAGLGHCGHWHSKGRAEFAPVCCWCSAEWKPSPGTGAAAGLGGGSTGHSGPVLPPNSPRQSLGVDDGATAAPATTRADASNHPGGSRCPSGSPIPFDLILRGWR